MGIKYTVTRTGDKSFKNEYTAQCRNCYGSGFILPALPPEAGPIDCPVCLGSGEVDVTKMIEVSVKPHKNK
jgi:DnaJ-class molecular chaperone